MFLRERVIGKNTKWILECSGCSNFFLQPFKPFVRSRKGVKGSDINSKVDGKIISNRETVVKILVFDFASIADDIGDVNVRNASVSDLNNHLSVLHKKNANCSFVQTNNVKSACGGGGLCIEAKLFC